MGSDPILCAGSTRGFLSTAAEISEISTPTGNISTNIMGMRYSGLRYIFCERFRVRDRLIHLGRRAASGLRRVHHVRLVEGDEVEAAVRARNLPGDGIEDAGDRADAESDAERGQEPDDTPEHLVAIGLDAEEHGGERHDHHEVGEQHPHDRHLAGLRGEHAPHHGNADDESGDDAVAKDESEHGAPVWLTWAHQKATLARPAIV